MAKVSSGKKYVSTRTVYKAVKKYDHQQFDEFCTRIYENGYNDGLQHPHEELAKAVGMEELMQAIGTVKGVGPAMMGKIRTAVDEMFVKKKESLEGKE